MDEEAGVVVKDKKEPAEWKCTKIDRVFLKFLSAYRH
jgi:hypothetical protein